MKSVYDNIKVLASLVPATRTADANGSSVDALGYNSAQAVIVAGDIDLTDTDETYAFKVQHSSDNSSWSDVTGATTTVTADNQVKVIRLDGIGTSISRYLRIVLDVGGTSPSIPCSGVFNLGRAFRGPVN